VRSTKRHVGACAVICNDLQREQGIGQIVRTERISRAIASCVFPLPEWRRVIFVSKMKISGRRRRRCTGR
jgi:hypothetical protein